MADPFQIQSPLVGDFGGLQFPLNASDFDGSFVPLDPVRSRMTALFKSAINYELGPIWNKVTSKIALLQDTSPVMSTFELDPNTHNIKQVGLKHPILALHRVGEATWSEHSMQEDKCDQDWTMHYILPNLDVADTRKISDVLRIIPEIVRRVIRSRGHISYEDGRLQFFPESGGLGSIQMTKSEWGQASFGGQVESPVWLATTITIHTVEYGSDSEEEFGELDSIIWNIGVGDSTGIIPNIIEAEIDV